VTNPTADAVWHAHQDGTQYGPYTLDELRGHFSSGAFRADAEVWRDGMASWVPAADMAEIAAVLPPVTPAPPPEPRPPQPRPPQPVRIASVPVTAASSSVVSGILGSIGRKAVGSVVTTVVVAGAVLLITGRDRTREVTELYNAGTAALQAQRPAEALPSFNRAIEIDPTHASSYLNRGVAHLDLGDTAAALADFDRIIEDSVVRRVATIEYQEHTLGKAYLNRALVRDRRELWESAVENYEAASGNGMVEGMARAREIRQWLADSARAAQRGRRRR